ncbi:MAG: bifunctional homocysteine S-methyltransferase/methylenetetrahydrofolate reductase [Candidatus Zixiibacteriota bacterium]
MSIEHPLFARLKQGPILADGAMGTLLYQRGFSFERCFEELNLSEPSVVLRVHQDYLDAGACLIETNTFGGNRARLTAHGLESKVRDINFRGVKLAREAREVQGVDALVGGAMGPIGRALKPREAYTLNEARTMFEEQAAALLEGGVDLFMIETMPSIDELGVAIEAIRSLCDLPIVAQVTFTHEGLSLTGQTPEEVGRFLEQSEADVVGANCSVGPQNLLEVIYRMAQVVSKPLSALPNAGIPRIAGRRFVYTASPEYFASLVGAFLSNGVQILGGCCGTTPDHIAMMAEAMENAPLMVSSGAAYTEVHERSAPDEAEPKRRGPRFIEDLGKRFQISVELDPPKGTNPEKILKGAQLCKERGCDAVNVGDSPMARVRMSAIAICALIERDIGIDAILHFTCRDRNLMGIQSDLIGAHALGVRTVLAITGDPPSLGNSYATGVYDVDAIGLTKILSELNQGRDYLGSSVGKGTDFNIGVALNPVADDWSVELDRFRQKVDAGAQFAFTQPLYEMEPLERCLEDVAKFNIPIFLGLLPLMSFRHASFMHNEVPGIEVPRQHLQIMEKAGDNGADAGVDICRELLAKAKQLVNGVYLMPSFGRYETCLRVIDGFTERPMDVVDIEAEVAG